MKQFRLLRNLSSKSSAVSSAVSSAISSRAVSLFANNRTTTDSSSSSSTTQQLLHQGDAVHQKPCQLKSYSSFSDQPGTEKRVASVTVDPGLRSCHVTWEDGFISQFHSAWLRHNCHSEESRHPNGQKLLKPSSVSCSLVINSAVVKDTSLVVTWSGPNGSHTGHIPTDFLRSHNYNRQTLLDRRVQVKPEPASEIPKVSYDDILNKEGCLYRWIRHINEEGICIIENVPPREDMVEKVAEMIGPVMPTIYGSTFDVEKTPDEINVAYSSLPIGLHQDLVYFESPPGLQLLHCMEFDECVEGGHSIFLDVFDMADKFRVMYPDLFQTLTQVPATFQKVHYDRNLPVHLVNQKPHIKLNHLGEVCAVYWAPPFEGPLAVDANDVEKYYLAYETFAKLLEKGKLLRYHLRPGDLVVFNNLRMLHGRDGFKTNGGARRLRGCYLNIDIFKSQVQVLHNLEGDGRLAKRVGNQCWF
ncbi:gamma-butyrobetaine dioxygenase-like isoform X1 [Elysia marginata]|uniref:Gamma-butyrobetaine dioxygenase-like isoform X1 n=1 Tax=Elysia marginata TaxID=1093978 RepID=A0AAV4F523_9GAST|nr:gamma-butyrobetaine dioxygenase-like isoform X1 [Elysia marginata]